ncbi:MAG: MFS transporter [Thermoplasmatota archaeon]
MAGSHSDRRQKALRFVVTIGVLSLFADIVYEGAHSVNGQFLQSLGASAFVVGGVAGLGELAAYGLRFVSGRWADRTRSYWGLVIFGYVVNLLAVPLTGLAGNWPLAAAFMLLERAGKAIRNPARDALFSHAAKTVGTGWAWGIHEALDETGAALGPALVAGVLWLRGGFHLVYGILLLPAIVSLSVLAYARRTNPRPTDLEPASPHAGGRGFSRRFWLFVAVGALVGAGFADFSLIAFHLAKTNALGNASIPLLYGMANAVNAVASLGLGRAFDRQGPSVLGATILIPALSAPLVFSRTPALIVTGIVLWGLSVTVQQGLFKAMLTRLLPAHRRATGFGTFDGAWGVASFAGGLLLGWLYDVNVGLLIVVSTTLLLVAAPVTWWLSRRA